MPARPAVPDRLIPGRAMLKFRFMLALAAGLAATPALAQADLLTEKKTFEMPSYTTAGGGTIRNVRIGWESYGTLNQDRSNAVLITHFYSGTSHAAGKYKADEKTAGYWDSIIGPGKAIDTNKYFVLSSDTLANLNANLPGVVTTGPASINPDTGKPYGTSFPVVTMRDFVNVQKALLESLGIAKVKIVGASMGALQAYEWAVAYPDMVDRIVPVIGAAGGDPFLIAWLDIWAQPIRVDPKWNGGDYYGKEPPLEGLKASLKIISHHANHWEWTNKNQPHEPAEAGKDPAAAFGNKFKVEAWLDQIAGTRAAISDANHLLYLVKANQLTSADPSKIKTPSLLLYSPNDLVFPAQLVEETARKISATGTSAETGQLPGAMGHLNGVFGIAQAGDKIKAFLEK
jgi:homoserine O-acetyltransferase